MKREKQKNPNKTTILAKLKESIMSEEGLDSKGVEDLSKRVDSPDDVAELIERIEHIRKSKKNNILTLAYHHGIIKNYKENSRFTSGVAKFKISKTTINIKIGIIKFIDDYPKMRKPSISLHFLKNNFRVIKDVCKESSSEFQ